jgi:alpha-tubulin suppressor-like RCC1 family protein
LLQDGTVYGLGRNTNGQLGCNTKITQSTCPILIDIPEKSKVIKMSTGSKHSLMLLENGNVYACGSNDVGACGLGGQKTQIKDYLKFTKIESLKNIIDISCGSEFSLAVAADGSVYSFGHPEGGQLGLGSNGEFIAKAGKVSYTYVTTPTLITKFISKEVVFGSNQPKVKEINEKIKIVKVACGKNHSLALEDWENSSRGGNRLFSWGNSGNGRTGHNNQDDILYPCEINALSDPDNKNITKHIRDIACGSTFSVGISRTRNLFHFGKLVNAPRSEATMYPKMMNELVGYPIRNVDCGQNLIMLSSSDLSIGWGVPTAGKVGFINDTKGSTVPTLISKVNGLYVSNISCGQYHVCMVVTEEKLPAVSTEGHSSFSHKSQGNTVKINEIPIWIDLTSKKRKIGKNDDNDVDKSRRNKKKK